MLRVTQRMRPAPSMGPITVVADDTALEITTFRTEGAYLDHRHPSEVIFTDSIEEDLARRDFTVNAMAFHLHAASSIPSVARPTCAKE